MIAELVEKLKLSIVISTQKTTTVFGLLWRNQSAKATGFLFVVLLFVSSMEVLCQTNTFPPSGNVGIGTTVPTEKLVVNGSISIIDGGSFKVLSSNNAIWANSSILSRGYITQDYTDLLVPGNEVNHAYLRLNANGNVGIGVPMPDSKLTVNGNIRAREIKVENSNWPDFVFRKDYKLFSLKATEIYIKQNGHLPGIPSTSDVNENGINLGEMNAKLLQKIEELTLYLIEIKKENEQFGKDIAILKSKVK